MTPIWMGLKLVLTQAWRWIRKYWYVFVAVAGGLVAILVLRRKPGEATNAVLEELRVAAEEAWIAGVAATSGRDVALDAIRQRYVNEAAELDAKERTRAAALQDNPEELAHLLLRAGRRRGTRTKL